jgi:hypothetical protein
MKFIVLASLFVLSVVAEPEAQYGFVRHSNGAVTPEDTPEVKFAKEVHAKAHANVYQAPLVYTHHQTPLVYTHHQKVATPVVYTHHQKVVAPVTYTHHQNVAPVVYTHHQNVETPVVYNQEVEAQPEEQQTVYNTKPLFYAQEQEVHTNQKVQQTPIVYADKPTVQATPTVYKQEQVVYTQQAQPLVYTHQTQPLVYTHQTQPLVYAHQTQPMVYTHQPFVYNAHHSIHKRDAEAEPQYYNQFVYNVPRYYTSAYNYPSTFYNYASTFYTTPFTAYTVPRF